VGGGRHCRLLRWNNFRMLPGDSDEERQIDGCDDG
jgi:hypothetical protein